VYIGVYSTALDLTRMPARPAAGLNRPHSFSQHCAALRLLTRPSRLACVPVPPLKTVTVSLAERGMLPAIWFIFSRRECDLAARHLQVHGSSLTTPAGDFNTEGGWPGG
jgi:superfamily II RNA helicase